MFQQLLEKISKVSIALNGRLEERDGMIINTIIFGSDFSWDVMEYKKKYFKKLRLKEISLLKIQQEIYREDLSEKELKILLQEIENRLLKLEFLRYIYNTEAQKIDPNIQVHYPYSIEIYNKAFYGVTKKDIGDNIQPHACNIYEKTYKKSELLILIDKAKSICPEIEFKFWKFPNFAHSRWVIKIPNQKYYNLQSLITLFFHETTHFFRTFNWTRNLGFPFQFAWYSTLEEWMAIYNEYTYGNKICNYGEFIPYYNLCIKVLCTDISESEKKDKIYEILSCKWFNRERSDQYYNRFYKYCQIWWNHLFLKDLIYYNWYKNVRRLIRKDSENYQKIMAGDIWIQELAQWLVEPENNYNSKKFFQYMVKEIRKIAVLHEDESFLKRTNNVKENK